MFGQQIDVEFSRNGLYLFKELGMGSSKIIDYNLTDDGELYVLYESDINRKLIRLHKNGQKDITFNFTSAILSNEGTTPVAMSATKDGTVVVLSNLWNGFSWMIHINEFFENGALNQEFGRRGIYTKSILDNTDDNFGKYLYTSSNDEIVVVAKINDFSVSVTDEKIAILKLSREGRTLSSDLYANSCFQLNSSAMQDDYLLLAYSETARNETNYATYLAGLDSERMESQNVHCLSTDGNYETIDQIVLTKSAVYISQLKINAEALYLIRKYDLNGNLDGTFRDTGEIDSDADLYDSNFIVGEQGEIFVVSKSLNDNSEILVKKLNSDGTIDETFGVNGIASIVFRYPIIELSKIQIDRKNKLYIAGDMAIEGNSYGFITRIKTDVLLLKKEKLDKFIRNLFVKRQ
ncbi:hypothetical protein GCM10022258_03530 [Aquimarina gracilis]